jgi:hypothetical protein
LIIPTQNPANFQVKVQMHDNCVQKRAEMPKFSRWAYGERDVHGMLRKNKKK